MEISDSVVISLDFRPQLIAAERAEVVGRNVARIYLVGARGASRYTKQASRDQCL